MKKIITKNSIQEAVSVLTKDKEVITIKELCNYLKCCDKTLRKIIYEERLYDVLPDCFRTILSTKTVFDTLNRENSMWLGYLTADGCVANRQGKAASTLMLECKTTDEEILKAFCDFLDIRYSRITSGHHNQSRCLGISNSNFSTPITEYGIVSNKSKKQIKIDERILTNDNFFYPFFRGTIIGDGTIHTSYSSKGISLVSTSYPFLKQMRDKLILDLPCPTSVWLMTSYKKDKMPLHLLKVGTGFRKENLLFLFNNFYKTDEDKIILSRKYQDFLSILK